VIVNETTARRYWPGAEPIGKHLANSRDMISREVVGVAADVKFRTLDAPNVEEMYLPVAQSPSPVMTLLVRSEQDPRPLAASVRQELARMDPDLATGGVQSLDEIVSGSVAQPQLVERVVAAFAMLALVLASIGIYGVMSFSVAERTREFGIRVALGAGPREILGIVLGEGLGLTVAGMGIGLVASLALTRLLAGLLFGITPTDPVTFGSALLALAATALLACFVPAWRGMCLSPLRALRDA
jgi:putative ABC transport system permease protein